MSWRENKSRGGFPRGGRGRGNYRGGYRGGYQNRQYNKRPPIYPYQDGKRTKFDVTQRLKEVDVGITEFMSDHDHFTGIVKERFNDFHVHEINSDGEIAKLTTQEIPPEPEEVLDMEVLRKSLPQETLDQIDSLTKSNTDIKSIEINVTDLDKDQRRNIHAIAKKNPSIISQTIEKDGQKLMSLFKGDKNRKGYGHYRDVRVDWSRREGPYCQFLLHKVNLDTMDALNQIGMYLRLKPNMFHYSGTKDRRARTTQWVCLKRINPADILAAGKSVRGAFVGNFKFVKEPLKLGDLQGNRFTIALRNVTATDEEIDKAMTNLRDNGFINYYGLQRFGTVANTPTHDIGKALLQGKWEEAVDLILKPRSGDQVDLAEAREIYAKTKDAAAALKKIHRHDKIEAKLLKGILLNGKTNFQGALDFVPRNTSLMYIHAYQSFVWNNIVSRRIKEHGRKPIVGDLVYETSDVKEEAETLDYSVPNEDEGHNKGDEVSTDMKKEEEPKEVGTDEAIKIKTDAAVDNNDERMDADVITDQKVSENNEEKNKDESKETEGLKDNEQNTNDALIEKDNHRPLPNVKILTEEDLPNYTLADVVMPQPGWRVVYPPYAKVWYEEFLANDELDTDLRQKNKKYSLGGAYRKILQIPENLSWRIMHYKDIYDELISCDIDVLRGNEGPKDDPEGKYKALLLEMSLRSSTYATMALREVLKHDTSAETQAAQSAAYHAQNEAENKKIEDKAENKNNEDESLENIDKNEVKDKEDKNEEVKMEVVEEEAKDSPMEQETTDTVSGTNNENLSKVE